MGYPDPGQTYDVLCCLYNTIQGPLFVSALFSTVWYHNKSPFCCDEFKIRLPYVVTDRHFIKFTAQQINVNRDKGTQRQSLLGRIGLVSGVDEEVDTAIIVGIGYLSMQDRSTQSVNDNTSNTSLDVSFPLIQDKEHLVTFSMPKDRDSIGTPNDGPAALNSSGLTDAEKRISMTKNSRRQSAAPPAEQGPAPILKVSTRALSSLASNCARVQRVLSKPPVPLGQLTKSMVLMNHHEFAHEFTYHEDVIAKGIGDLYSAVPLEMNNHFLVLMRILLRAMCGGNGIYSEAYSDPYNHTQLRSMSFLIMLQMFSRLCPELSNTQLGSSVNVSNLGLMDAERLHDNEVLQAFADYVFDEEIPLTISKQRPASGNLSVTPQISARGETTTPSDAPRTPDRGDFSSPWAVTMSSMAKEVDDNVKVRQNVTNIYAANDEITAVRQSSVSSVDQSPGDGEVDLSVDLSSEMNGDNASEDGSAQENNHNSHDSLNLSAAALTALNDTASNDGTENNSDDFNAANVAANSSSGYSTSNYNSGMTPGNSIRAALSRVPTDKDGNPNISVDDDEDEDGYEYEVGSPSANLPNQAEITRKAVGHAVSIRSRNEAIAVSVDFNDISFGPSEDVDDNANNRSTESEPSEQSTVLTPTESEEVPRASLQGNNLAKIIGSTVNLHHHYHLDANGNESSAVPTIEQLIASEKSPMGSESSHSSLSTESLQVYEAYVAEHYALEFERLVLELELNAAVEEIVKEIPEEVKANLRDLSLESLYDKFNRSNSSARWWSETLNLRGKNSSDADGRSPFDAEAFWFKYVDDNIRSICGTGLVGPNTMQEAHIIISKPAPLFSTIEGYRQRKPDIVAAAAAAEEAAAKQRELDDKQFAEVRITSPTESLMSEDKSTKSTPATRLNRSASGFSLSYENNVINPNDAPHLIFVRRTNTPVHTHWWPWVYEVITFQWVTLLKAFHKRPPLQRNDLRPSSPDINENDSSSGYTQFFHSSAKYFNVDTRWLLTDKAPILLKIIQKSLIARIVRDNKRSPVVLDEEYFISLSELIVELATESGLAQVPGRAKLIISSVSSFLRIMFAFVVPAQMQVLVSKFMEHLEVTNTDEEIDRRLTVLEDLIRFEYFMSATLPYLPDISKHLVGKYLASAISSGNADAGLQLQCVLDGANVVPRAHWLVDLVVQSCMKIYKRPMFESDRKGGINSNTSALRVLRELFEHAAFDKRYQQASVRQRVAVMFWPLFYELLDEMNTISMKNVDADDRKQILGILLTILQDTPDDIVRDQLRRLAASATPFELKFLLPYNYSGANNLVLVKELSGRRPTNQDLMANLTVLRANSANTSSNRLWYFIHFLHMSLESFTVQTTPAGTNTSSSATGGVSSSSSAATVAGTQRRHSDNPTNVMASTNQKLTLLEKNRAARAATMALNPENEKGSTTVDNTKGKLRAQKAWKSYEPSRDWKLASFNAVYASSITVIRIAHLMIDECSPILYSTGFDNPTGSTTTTTASSITGNGNGAANKNSVGPSLVSPLVVSSSYEGILSSVMFVMLHALSLPEEQECHSKLLAIATTAVANWGAKLFAKVVGDTLQDWLRLAMKFLCYHTVEEERTYHYHDGPAASATNTAGSAVPSAETAANPSVNKDGNAAAGGALKLNILSANALSFVCTLLKAQFVYYGNITLVSDTMLAVFDDVIEHLLNYFSGIMHTHEEEDHLLAPFLHCLQILKLESQQELKRGTNKMFASYHYAVIRLAQDLELLVFAHSQLRRYIPNHVIYDWQGTSISTTKPGRGCI
jgi:hypothetical protein